jgi:hypothetical protein
VAIITELSIYWTCTEWEMFPQFPASQKKQNRRLAKFLPKNSRSTAKTMGDGVGN